MIIAPHRFLSKGEQRRSVAPKNGTLTCGPSRLQQLVWHGPLHLRLQEAFFASLLVLRRQHTLGMLVLLTVVITALDVVRVTAVFRAMDVPLGTALVVFTYLGAAMLGMALLIPGGVGVTEVSMAGLIAFLAPGVVMKDLTRSTVLIDRFFSYYLLVLIGAGLLVAYHRFRRAFV